MIGAAENVPEMRWRPGGSHRPSIAHLAASPCFGGPERQMLGLGRALHSDYTSVFISFLEEGRCWDFIAKARSEGFEAYALRQDTPRLIAALRELVGLLRRINPGVLVCHGYKPNLLGLVAGRLMGIPVVSVSRGWTGESRRVKLFDALDRRVLRWVDHVVCVSNGQAEKVRRAGVLSDKSSVIHNAVRVERFANPQPHYRGRLNQMFAEVPEQIIGAAGRLSPEKGFDVLIDAAAAVIDQRPRLGFVLFGEGGLRESLARQIRERKLEGRFILAGFQSDLDCYLSNLDLFVLPSHSEGLPNVILEAFAASVPVVATAVGGTPELVENGVTGFLTPANDASALARRIRELADNPSLGKLMGVNGRRLVNRHFTFSQQAQAYNRLVGRLAPGMAMRGSLVSAI